MDRDGVLWLEFRHSRIWHSGIWNLESGPEGAAHPMIPRVLEPEAMDSPEEVRQYDAMDHSEVNDRFVADFLAAHGACRGGEILDVGTGTARIPIALARADAKARILALDLAENMLARAAENVAE